MKTRFAPHQTSGYDTHNKDSNNKRRRRKKERKEEEVGKSRPVEENHVKLSKITPNRGKTCRIEGNHAKSRKNVPNRETVNPCESLVY